MAYFVDVTNVTSDGNANSITATVPEDYRSGDLLLAFMSQNNAGSTHSAPVGWTEVTTQAGAWGQRISAWYKFAGSSEPALTMTSSGTANISLSLQVWRGVDSTTPIHVSTRVDTPTTAESTAQFGSLTTTNNDCTIVYAVSYQGIGTQGKLTVADPSSMTSVTRLHNTSCLLSGYKAQPTAGAVDRPIVWSERTSNGGTLITLALNDDGNGNYPSEVKQNYTPVLRGGLFTEVHEYPASGWAALDTMTPTSIASIPVSSFMPTIQSSNTADALDPWGFMTGLSHQTSGIDATGIWIGGVFAPTGGLDMTDKLFSINFFPNNVASANLGAEGMCMVFEDSSNAWVAINLSKRDDIVQGQQYVLVADPDTMPILDSSGTIDWSDIEKIGFGWHRVNTATTTRVLYIKNFVLFDKAILTGGNSDLPLTPAFLRRAIHGWNLAEVTPLQGTSQMLSRIPVQLGNGTDETYFNSKGSSYELPRSYTPSIARRFWRVPEERVDLTVYASADDTYRFSGVYNTNTKQRFVIHPSSSTDATYTFDGSSWSGWEIDGKAGVTFNGASYDGCYIIDLKGGGMFNCSVLDSLDSIAVTTTDPGEIANTSFTSAGTGHAIEATATGTFAFEGNTFSGYGADGTTDAAFYNNSGGEITLVIPAEDDAPTVLNGPGATTIIDTPTANQSVTITNGEANTRIWIYDENADEELANEVVTTFPFVWTDPNVYVADRQIRLRASWVDGTSAKRFVDQIIGTATQATPAVGFQLNQEDDPVYNINAIDGSAVTGVTIQDSVMIAEIDTGSLSWAALYAYETYWRYTETGIAENGQLITAIDPANYLFDDLIISNVTSPEVPLIMTGGYARNLTTGATIDVFDTDGGRTFNAPDHVVAYATGSGVTPEDITAIRSGLALESNATSNKEAIESKVQEVADAQKLPNLLIKDKLSQSKYQLIFNRYNYIQTIQEHLQVRSIINNIRQSMLQKKQLSVAVKQVDQSAKRITAVVTAPTVDRDNDIIDTMSLKLPLKGGGMIKVAEMQGKQDVLIPFMLDHSWSVQNQIGSGQKAWVNEAGELVVEFVFSSRDIAQDVFTLIDEGHIDNSFSITVMYDMNSVEERADDGYYISEGEVVEISLVFKGSNRNARLLEVQKKWEAKMPKTLAELEAEKKALDEQIAAKQAEEAQDTEEVTEEVETEAEATEEVETKEQNDESESEEEAEQEESEETEEVTKSIKKEKSVKTTEQEIAQEAVVAKGEVVEQPKQAEKLDKYEFAAKQFVAWVTKDSKTLAELNQKALDSYKGFKSKETYHNTGVTADGGAIVPEAQLLADIYSTLGEFSTVAQDLRVVTLTEGDALDVATLVTDVIVTEVASEGGDKDVTKMVLGDSEISLREFAGIAIITKKLVRQAAINVFNLLRESFARAIANRRAVLALTDATSGIVNKQGVAEVVASGSDVTGYTWTDVKKMPYQIPVAAVSGAKYYISRELLEQLDTLKDEEGRDLDIVELSGDQLSGRFKNGYSFAVEEVLGKNGNPHAVFGSMGRYGILLRQATVEAETFDQGTVTDGDEVEHNLIQQNKLAHRVAFYENVGYPVPGAFAVLVDASQ